MKPSRARTAMVFAPAVARVIDGPNSLYTCSSEIFAGIISSKGCNVHSGSRVFVLIFYAEMRCFP